MGTLFGSSIISGVISPSFPHFTKSKHAPTPTFDPSLFITILHPSFISASGLHGILGATFTLLLSSCRHSLHSSVHVNIDPLYDAFSGAIVLAHHVRTLISHSNADAAYCMMPHSLLTSFSVTRFAAITSSIASSSAATASSSSTTPPFVNFNPAILPSVLIVLSIFDDTSFPNTLRHADNILCLFPHC